MGFEVTDIDSFSFYFEKLAREIKPFEIRMKGIDFFDEGIIYLDVEKNTQLETLRQKILRDLSQDHGIKPYPIEGNQFHFHATLAYGLSKNDFKTACKSFKKHDVEFKFMLEKIGLLCYIGDQWITYKKAMLEKHTFHPL
ncbi:MAG: 2'-5' RNA ligase family protein [Planctomycetes bacterium]|nr:2'-5' RNA ligase family protein [Planctomycetota bacterium]